MDAEPLDPSEPADVDAIADALARLRGRGRMPFGPDGWPVNGHDGPHGYGGHREHEHRRGRGGPQGRGGPGPFGPHGWGPGGARMGGPARMRLLEALAAASHPLSVGEVGDAIGVDQPRASRLVQQGVELGLVRREADPDDARRTRIALTDDGERLARGFRGQRREHLSQALAGFSDAERAELARLLTKLARAWPAE